MSSATMTTTVALALILAAFCIASSSALSCWQCNSEGNEFCLQTPDGPVANASKIPGCLQDLYKECPKDDQGRDPFCRRTEQSIKGKVRVIRSCGYERAEQDCYTTKTPSVGTKVCQCFTDGCNSSSSLVAGFFTILAAFAITRLVVY